MYRPDKNSFSKAKWKKIITLVEDGYHPFGAENTEWYEEEGIDLDKNKDK